MRKYNWNEENKAQNDFFAYIFNSPIVCHVCQACAKESIWATRTPIPRAKFRRITEETTRFPQNKRKKIETLIEICKTKQKNGKEKLPSLRTQSLLKNGYLVDYPFCLSFTESYILQKHRDLLACVVGVTRVRQLGSDSKKACPILTTTFANAQKFKRCVEGLTISFFSLQMGTKIEKNAS